MGIIRVVHRLAALWLLASGLGNSLGEVAMVAPRRATVEVDRRCRRTSQLPICGWSGDKDSNNRTSDVWRAPRQILRVRALPCIGDHYLAERLIVEPELMDYLCGSARRTVLQCSFFEDPSSCEDQSMKQPNRPPEANRTGPAAWHGIRGGPRCVHKRA